MKVYINSKKWIEEHLTDKDFEDIKKLKLKELTEKAHQIEEEMHQPTSNN